MPQNRLRELRELQGLSQAQLAKRIGIHPSRISRWEAGQGTIPDWRKAQLAETLRCSVPYLMGWPDGNGSNGEGDGDGDAQRRVA